MAWVFSGSKNTSPKIDLLSQWLTGLKLLGDSIFSRENQPFKLFFQGPGRLSEEKLRRLDFFNNPKQKSVLSIPFPPKEKRGTPPSGKHQPCVFPEITSSGNGK